MKIFLINQLINAKFFDQLINQWKFLWLINVKKLQKHSPLSPNVKNFHFYKEYKSVSKWYNCTIGGPNCHFWTCFQKSKNLKKNFLEYRPGAQIGSPFFQRGKTLSKRSQTELKKIWGESLIFSLQPCRRKRYPHRAKFWDTEGSNMAKTEN